MVGAFGSLILLPVGSGSKVFYYRSHAVSYSYETEFEIWSGFGQAGKFKVHGFLALFITILSRI